MIRARVAICVLSLTAMPVWAVDLPLPGNAVEVARIEEEGVALDLPLGPWNGANVPTLGVEGDARRVVWQIPGQATARQIIEALRPALEDQGWRVVFECRDAVCGGYDFRFSTNTLPAPEMYVDLGNYRYLLAEKETGSALSLMVSQAGRIAFVQATEIDPAPVSEPALVASSKSVERTEEDLSGTLDREGRAALEGLVFESGAVTLGEGADDTLEAIAAYLDMHPDHRFAIVGHTDSQGSLDSNITLSERRARTVRRALIDVHDVSPAQIEARGIGSLAPRGSNESGEGRQANRRVEIVRID
ncbi:OmpA family protein [Palleronia sp. LCG004]|uniref:OmpA family protein n=1 Tax=Palleronia sp. LCG004 TaxID=3079304 RepID=UPI002942DD78|nr:OmpA family protein [Palleronia sp. LCG004]WOI56045.1 OmpA family protein [Palleronia sp. LCG004]